MLDCKKIEDIAAQAAADAGGYYRVADVTAKEVDGEVAYTVSYWRKGGDATKVMHSQTVTGIDVAEILEQLEADLREAARQCQK